MKIKQQTHKYSCWPCCILMALDHFWIEHQYSELDIMKMCWVSSYKWTTPHWVYNILRKLLPEWKWYKCTLHTYWDLETFIKQDNQSIDICLTMYERNKNPNHSNTNTDHFGMHYIIAQLDWNIIHMHNPFWFEQEFSLEAFRDRMSLDKKYLDRKEKRLIRLWIVKPYTWIRIKKRPLNN